MVGTKENRKEQITERKDNFKREKAIESLRASGPTSWLFDLLAFFICIKKSDPVNSHDSLLESKVPGVSSKGDRHNSSQKDACFTYHNQSFNHTINQGATYNPYTYAQTT